jgi:hypothetical protein
MTSDDIRRYEEALLVIADLGPKLAGLARGHLAVRKLLMESESKVQAPPYCAECLHYGHVASDCPGRKTGLVVMGPDGVIIARG